MSINVSDPFPIQVTTDAGSVSASVNILASTIGPQGPGNATDADVANLVASGAQTGPAVDNRITTHSNKATGVHGVGSGTVVGTALTQTLTNKTLSTGTKVGGASTDISGAWATWTPTLTGFTGTITEARYMQIGKTVTFDLVVTLNAAVTANMYVTPPVTARNGGDSAGRLVGTAVAHQAGVTFRTGVTRLEGQVSSPRLYAHHDNTGGAWTPTTPFTWKSGDILHMAGTYEAA